MKGRLAGAIDYVTGLAVGGVLVYVVSPESWNVLTLMGLLAAATVVTYHATVGWFVDTRSGR